MMNNRLLSLFALGLAMGTSLVGGCDGEPIETNDSNPPPTEEPEVFEIALPEIEVPTGDSFECVYTGIFSDEDMSVHAIFGTQVAGGHHITTYFTDSKKTGHAPCTDEEMTEWHMIGGADVDDGGEPVVQLPDGIAYRVPAGKRIVAQLHYINTSGAPYMAQDEVRFELMDPDDVEAYANLFSIFLGVFEVAPNAETTAVGVSTIKQDIPMFMYGGHMHELGKHYKLETIDEDGNSLEVLYDEDWLPQYASHPPVKRFTKEEPFVLKKGMRLRQTCTWQNPTSEMVKFPTEMCLMFGFYSPDKGTGEIIQAAFPE